MSAVAGVMWDSGVHSSTTERWRRIWPLGCGLAAWAVTVPRSESLETALAALMSGYSGLFVAQFVDGHLIDLNLRVHSSLPLAVKAGVNLAAIYADLARGVTPPPGHAEPGHTYRWISGDLKGLISSLCAQERCRYLRRCGLCRLSQARFTRWSRGKTRFPWSPDSPLVSRGTSEYIRARRVGCAFG